MCDAITRKHHMSGGFPEVAARYFCTSFRSPGSMGITCSASAQSESGFCDVRHGGRMWILRAFAKQLIRPAVKRRAAMSESRGDLGRLTAAMALVFERPDTSRHPRHPDCRCHIPHPHP